MKVLICDDVLGRCNDTASRMLSESGIHADILAAGALTKTLKEFFNATNAYFQSPETQTSLPASRFDEYDLLILDNNLAELDIEGARMTAESIAGYIRAFSKAPYIVSLNKTPNVDFDLRYLVGDYSTRADLALNAEHLENPALWTGDVAKAKDRFCPWYWPSLLNVPTKRRSQINQLVDSLEKPVLEFLGFSDKRPEGLLPHARGVISPTAEMDGVGEHVKPIELVTFFDLFLTRDRSLAAPDDRERIQTVAKQGNNAARLVVARVVASDVEHFFRRDVIGPQEPLVDVAHLLMRLPFLLGDGADKCEVWNEAAHNTQAPYGLDEALYKEHLEPLRFRDDMWIPRPCFWWPEVKEIEALNERFLNASEGDWADAVFCEDSSLFTLRDKEKNLPTEFLAQVDGSWARRYVQQIEEFQYAPRTRLALSF